MVRDGEERETVLGSIEGDRTIFNTPKGEDLALGLTCPHLIQGDGLDVFSEIKVFHEV